MSVKELSRLVSARYPLIFIDTQEERRALDQMQGMPWKTLCWSVTKGLCMYRSAGSDTLVKDVRDPIRILDYIMGSPSGGTVFVLLGYEPFLHDSFITRKLKELAQYLRASSQDSIAILGSGLQVPDVLAAESAVLVWPLPDAKEFSDLIKSVAGDARFRKDIEAKGRLDSDTMARSMLGLTKLEAENALALSLVEKKGIDLEFVLKQKEEIVRRSGLLEYFRTPATMNDVGGMGNLKRWIQVRTSFILGSNRDKNNYRLPAPKGVLLMGIQGCGKTLFSQGLAHYWRLPLLKFDVGRVYSSTVGSSEKNMRDAIRVAESVAPAILLVDEIEKAMSGTHSSSYSDGGTSARVFATFLSWLQDRTKELFVIATANNLDLIPPELLRKGRFDEIFFVDLPAEAERRQIFRIHLEKHGVDPEKFDLDMLARSTEGYSGAEIEQIVISTLYESVYEKTEPCQGAMLKMAGHIVPLSQTMSDHVAAMRQWAVSRARPAGANIVQPVSLKKITNIVAKN